MPTKRPPVSYKLKTDVALIDKKIAGLFNVADEVIYSNLEN